MPAKVNVGAELEAPADRHAGSEGGGMAVAGGIAAAGDRGLRGRGYT